MSTFIQPASQRKILVTGSTGDTGRPTVKLLIERGHSVRAMAHKEDARADVLREMGAEVVVGDMLDLADVRSAVEGVRRAYFVYPLAAGLPEASVVFCQAAREERLEMVVNMSHKQSRPHARSKATLNHWLSEQVFNWSGLQVAHLRVTFFAEWLLYIAPLIRQGRYVVPFDPDSRFAPIPASDIAQIVTGILEHPQGHAGRAYSIHGPVEYSHQEIAAVVARVLGKEIRFEQVSVPDFLKLFGLEHDTAKSDHFEAVKIDQREGLLRGTDCNGTDIIGAPLTTLEAFVSEHRALLV